LILYLDTSSLVKLYLTEAYSGDVRGWVNDAEIVATCRIAYPEMVSVLTRRYRNGGLSKGDYKLVLKTFTAEWSHFAVVDFDEIAAGRLAEIHGLRGFDSVHLATAKQLKSSKHHISVAFSSFDVDLNKAAADEKLTVLEPK
jgi:predicted nucleic acid-binding protein